MAGSDKNEKAPAAVPEESVETDIAEDVEGEPVAAETEQASEPVEEASGAGGIEAITVDETELLAEIERLRAENEKLAAARTGESHWGRRVTAVLLIVFGAIIFGLAISAVWLNRTVMNEDRWVATVAPLAQNVAIQDYVANKAYSAIVTNVDIEGYVKQALGALPAQAQILASPITGAIQNLIRDSATKIVRSDQFYNLWVQMNRYAHKAFIAAISDKSSGVIQKQGGTVTLETTVLVDQIKQALSSKGLGFVNNINIPIKNQQIVLVDSPELAALGSAIQVMNTLAWLLPFLAIGLLAGGIAVAVDHRKAVLWVGIGITAATLLPLEAIYFGQTPFTAAAYNLGGMPSEAAQAAYTIVFRNLITAEQLFAVVGLVFVVGALLAGPSKFATSLRSGFSHGLASIGPDWDFGRFGEWVLAHQSGLRTSGIVAAVALLLVAPTKSYATIAWLVVGVIVWIALIALFGRPRPVKRESEAPQGQFG